jgi:cell division septum initiation protein DivIVA
MSQTQTSTETDPLVEALRRKVKLLEEQNETLLETVEELEARVNTLEARVPEPAKQEYDQLDKHDKATIVRQKLYETAKSTNGKAAMSYKDVIAVFDGNPSAGHAYDIMGLAGERDGFNYGQGQDGSKRLTVDSRTVKQPDQLSRREK